VTLDFDSGLFICDIKNHRIRRVDFATGSIATFAGTGERKSFPDGSAVEGTALNGPRSLALDAGGDLVIVLREGNAVYRLNRKSMTWRHLAGTGKQGYAGDGNDARLALLAGPKGVAVDGVGNILLCDTENHVIRMIERSTGQIKTLIGDGTKGDGPDGPPLKCRLNRPHGIFVAGDDVIYVGDSGNNKVRKLVR
jgi:sugar lactone lactonase YvrE